ncbi:hypothetical protein BGW39_010025 [Mortierella sp. 14UC]|nr:hypothetical protein BGW39_010025 [Mortierella sp. 14UC]
MSLQVSFTTHGHDLKTTYESILKPANPNNSNNWAMFGYDKGTNDLKVLGQGDGGLEELEDEFMDGKIQYAFVRIIDPNTELNKFILIAWCGDGVPESKKGLFNSHLADGYHLQINARCEADVTPAQILKRVNEGSGSKYSVHKETYEHERIRPLQSAYKKTEIPDIAAMQRNPTKPEPAPKFGVAKTFGSSTLSTPAPTTTSSPVARSWNAPVVNTPPPVSATKPAERTWKSGGSSYTGTAGVTFNKIAPPSSLLNYGNNNTSSTTTSSFASSTATTTTRNDPSMNKAQQMRLEREAREKEERERIKREIEASEARDRQAQGQTNAFKEAEEKRLKEEKLQREQRELDEQRQRSQDRAREERESREKEERARAEAEDAARSAREEMKAREQAAREDEQKRQKEQQQRQREKEEKEAAEKRAKQQREEEEKAEKKRLQTEEDARRRQEEEDEEREHDARVAAAAVATVATGAAVAAVASEASHPGHEAAPDSVSAVVLYAYEQSEENEMSLIEGEIIINVTELDVGWWSGESQDGTRSGLFPANYVEVIEVTQDYGAAAAAPAAAHYEEEEEHVAATNGHAYHAETAAESSGPSAVALYDYTAGEPNELSFNEGDVITDIEFVTDDWWNGTANGVSGLFPSNYVEMHQYVFEYALNHLQKENNNRNSNPVPTSSSNSNSRETTVLIVTDSRSTLREYTRQEQQICKELYYRPSSTRQDCQESTTAKRPPQRRGDLQEEEEAIKDPWAHLWPPPRPPPPEEYVTETPASSQATISRSGSTDPHHQQGPEQEGAEGDMSGGEAAKDDLSSFRADLWARIQIRYAPTIRHVLSLFRCLHLSPGSTFGKTFGPAAEEGYEAVVPSPGAGAGGSTNSPAPPTLVILLGCFGRDRSLEIRRFSMLDIIPVFADLQEFDEKEYMVEQSVADGAEERIDEEREEKEEKEELDDEELEELEYAEYIRMVANTMAEVTDSLAWLERFSRKPELLIVEDTGQHPTTPSQPFSSRITPNTQKEMMPTVRELWLQSVMGYWVDSSIKTERASVIQQGSIREAYKLWVRTQESLNAAFTTPLTATTQMSGMSEQAIEEVCSSSGITITATAAVAASMGAVLGVQWHFDSAGDRVHFEVIS